MRNNFSAFPSAIPPRNYLQPMEHMIEIKPGSLSTRRHHIRGQRLTSGRHTGLQGPLVAIPALWAHRGARVVWVVLREFPREHVLVDRSRGGAGHGPSAEAGVVDVEDAVCLCRYFVVHDRLVIFTDDIDAEFLHAAPSDDAQHHRKATYHHILALELKRLRLDTFLGQPIPIDKSPVGTLDVLDKDLAVVCPDLGVHP